jgi:hypothetical protein
MLLNNFAFRVLYVLAISVTAAHATIVIALRDGNTIVVGADSNGVGGEHVCKVFQHNDTVGGISGASDKGLGFDLPAITRGVVQNEKLNLSDKVKQFFQIATDTAKPLLNHTKTTKPQEFDDWVRGRRPVCEVVFATREGGRAIMYLATLRVSQNGDPLPMKPQESIGPSAGQSPPMRAYDGFSLGESDAAFRSLRSGKLPALELIPTVRTLMGIAMKDKPKEIDGPFSILQLSASSGITWIERGTCATDPPKVPAPKKKAAPARAKGR